MNPEKIFFESVSKIYEASDGTAAALDRLDLAVNQNEILALVGPSGCGKTTTINLAAGFIDPTSGRVLIDGHLAPPPDGTRAVVFQADSVFPWMTVADNVAFSLKLNGTPTEQNSSVVTHYLQLMGLVPFASRWPRELSGGLRKRVDLARAYASGAPVLLMDEPFGSLDVITKEDMQRLMLKLWEHRPCTILLVTHDIEEALFLAHRVAVMTPSPGSIKETLGVPFPIPREPSLKLTPEFMAMRRHVVELLTQAKSEATHTCPRSCLE